MHMADALVSPAVGGALWAAAAGAAVYSVKKVKMEADERKIPLMGVMGAFVFAVQMINFAIPGTGSSGHLGGGILLAALLGPYGGFLTMASILSIQALLFADGGLLALGCNIVNLGLYTCFISYPLIYKWLTRKHLSSKRIFAASLAAAVAGLQAGAFSVVLETFLSGKTELPLGAFLLVMQPVHLVIGIVEGLVTAAIITFVWRSHSDLLDQATVDQSRKKASRKRVLAIFLISALMIGGVLSWFASKNPDGLEWSMFQVAGKTELKASDRVHQILSDIQSKTAIFPDYQIKKPAGGEQAKSTSRANNERMVGGVVTLLLAVSAGFAIRSVKKFMRY